MWKWKHQQKSVSWGHGKKKYPGKLDEQIYGEDVKKKKRKYTNRNKSVEVVKKK